MKLGRRSLICISISGWIWISGGCLPGEYQFEPPVEAPPNVEVPLAACQSSLEQLCNGVCRETFRDPLNCGSCGNVCLGDDEVCLGGSCETVVKIAAGAAHTCAATKDGDVYCWGKNSAGQCGNSDSGLPNLQSPRRVVEGQARDLSAGFARTCYKTATEVFCFGANESAELGIGTTDSGAHPDAQQVVVMPPSGMVALGEHHSCAIHFAIPNTTWCWGENVQSQLGEGDAIPALSTIAIAVVGGSPAEDVIAGKNHSCILSDDGVVRCWGANDRGQVGDGTGNEQANAVNVPGISNITAMAAWDHTCAVKTTGELYCWGENKENQLGVTEMIEYSTMPIQVSDIDQVVAVAVGRGHTCVKRNDRSLWCWGSNSCGQLGAGGLPQLRHPELVMVDVEQVVAGENHTCALKIDGSIWCWGCNGSGQLGDGSNTESRVPVPTFGASSP